MTLEHDFEQSGEAQLEAMLAFDRAIASGGFPSASRCA